MNRRTPARDDGPEPTFEDYQTARRVMIQVRRGLDAAGQKAMLSECPVFGEIVFRSSPLCDPASFARTQLASAEGRYERSSSDAYAMRHGEGE